jgi:transketolase
VSSQAEQTTIGTKEPSVTASIDERYRELEKHFEHWQKTADIIDQLIDIILNYRQSGHPGGSRSKVHALLSLMLSGAMRWDIRHPEKRFGDRFVLGAGHTIPLLYCTFATLNETLRLKYEQTGDQKYLIPNAENRALFWEDLLNFRRRGGLSGHAEMEGKTLFLKFNTGPSGHGSPAAAGAALALKRAGCGEVKVFCIEGEAGLTPGSTHETMNSAWGLGLDNLYYLLDWNDYGIDDHRVSDAVYGTPTDWFASHGWRVVNTEEGSEWEPVLRTVLELTEGEHERQAPSIAWFKTRKGRGYLKYDNASHGVPHKRNSELFWETKESFTQKYGVEFANFGGAAPDDYKGVIAEFEANLRVVMDFLREDQALVDYLADRLVEIGESVPLDIGGFRLGKQGNPFDDPALYDFEQYPADLFAKPGEMAPNRAALSKWGAWANAFGATKYGRPLFLISSADLAGSTNINGFANGYGDFEGYGWYERYGTDEGVLLPQEITEFANSGIMAGIATVNLAEDPERNFDGFWAASSTYGSFSYLMYGLMRLFSQLAQDCQLKVGKTLWIAGHSGPETADDSRTHFGIFGPGVTQLFPEGHIINLHPWEHNEVPVLLGAALKTEVPIVGLHLTRPPVEIPDRTRLGIPSHFEAVRGAYVVRDYAEGMPHGGAFIVQGTSTMANIVKILPQLDEKKLNVKIVYAASPQLFARQPAEYRERVITAEDRVNSTVITTQARWLMHDWLFNKVSEEYALSADWDDRWRTGGNLEDVIEEAQLSPEWIVNGMQKFVDEKGKRLEQLASDLEAAST